MKKWMIAWPSAFITLLITIAAVSPPTIVTVISLFLILHTIVVRNFSIRSLNINLLQVVAPFFAIMFIGLMGGIGADRYVYFKDAWYIFNPVNLIIFGYALFLYMPNLGKGLKAFVIGGTIVALFHLTKLALQPELIGLSATSIRAKVGTGYYAPVLAIIIFFTYHGKWRTELLLPHWFALFCLIICSLAIISSFSRTMLVLVLIGIAAARGYFARREWLRIGAVLVIGLLIIFLMRSSVDVNGSESANSFIGKLARVTDELIIKDYFDERDINLNWRGYETAKALQAYFSGDPVNLIFGYGFGAQLDIGVFMPLFQGKNGEKILTDSIPTLHNGYAYLLFKGGPTAVGLFIFVLFSMYRLGRRNAIDINYYAGGESLIMLGRLLQAIVVSLAFTTWVIGGVFNKLDLTPFLILAGFLLAAISCKFKSRSLGPSSFGAGRRVNSKIKNKVNY